MKQEEERKKKGLQFQDPFLLGYWGKMEIQEAVILEDKIRETCENITYPSLLTS